MSTTIDGYESRALRGGAEVALDPQLLREAREARDRLVNVQREAELAQVGYQHAIRRLHAAGGSLRQIADAFGLSYQRVHQIVDVASGKGAIRRCRVDAFCSFCGAHSNDVTKLIAGPGVFICGDCVRLMRRVAVEGHEVTHQGTSLVSTSPVESTARCSFCGHKPKRVGARAEAPNRPPVGKSARRSGSMRICDKCLALCEGILREEFISA